MSLTDPAIDTATQALATTRHHAVLGDGTPVLVRPLHPEDIELERSFIEALSPQSRRYRFLQAMRSPSDALLRQMMTINPATDAAFVAVLGEGDEAREIGVARFSASAGGQDCEFAVTVADEWQNKGLGTLLMHRLMEVAKGRGIKSMQSSDAADNSIMREFARHLHFHHKPDPQDAKLVRYSVELGGSGLMPA